MKWVLIFALLFPVFWKFTTAENTLSENNFIFKVEAPVQYQVIQREDQDYGWVDVQVSATAPPSLISSWSIALFSMVKIDLGKS